MAAANGMKPLKFQHADYWLVDSYYLYLDRNNCTENQMGRALPTPPSLWRHQNLYKSLVDRVRAKSLSEQFPEVADQLTEE